MIKQHGAYKVAMISDCLAGGGAEKVHALLSKYFSEQGIEVYNCVLADNVQYDYSGTLFNLGLISPRAGSLMRKLNRFKEFRRFIRSQEFDAVIDFRMRTSSLQELAIATWIYRRGTVYTIHSGRIDFYFPAPASLFASVFKKFRMVSVSEALRKELLSRKLAEEVLTIYNPVEPTDLNGIRQFSGRYITAVGRMNDNIKQFDQLIEAYSKTTLPSKGICLLLIGEGGYLEQYKAAAIRCGVGDTVHFTGFVQNPADYYQYAMLTVLSSKNEGFPNVLVESLAVGTPVVAFDCFSGPSEIIAHEQNGMLVADQDFGLLAQAIERMAGDEELYERCKSNAAASVKRFSLDNIGRQWLDYLNFS